MVQAMTKNAFFKAYRTQGCEIVPNRKRGWYTAYRDNRLVARYWALAGYCETYAEEEILTDSLT